MAEEEQDEAYEPTDFVLKEASNESIKVLVRVRPLSQDEKENHGSESAVTIHDEASLTIFNSETRKQFDCSFDKVLGDSSKQEDVYNILKTCTQSVTDGFNSTIFAYGQTGSGKTHTMFGPPNKDLYSENLSLEDSTVGLIPRAVHEIFELSGHPEVIQFSVLCSFIQLYNENCFDMLRDAGMTTPLPIREDRKEIYVQGLSEYIVKSVGETMQLLKIAEDNRAIRETHMNQFSSRSHSIFQIFVEQRRLSPDGGEVSLRAKFNLVDLAGSEKWNTKQNMEHEHISELTNINLSLHTLGKCISALVGARHGKSKVSHIPYRDSKLTRLLQDSLGGNSRTYLIATLSPSLANTEESISTLKFADRAKQVMVQIHVNETRPVDHEMVIKLQREVQYLRKMLRKYTEQSLPAANSVATAPHINTNTDANMPHCTTALVDAEGARRYEENNLQYIEDINQQKQAKNEMDFAFRQADDAIKIQKIAALEQENEQLRHQLRQRASSLDAPVPHSSAGPGNNDDLKVKNVRLKESLKAIQSNQDMLWVQVNTLQDTLKKFFVFEIEEDAMRTMTEQVFSTLSELRSKHDQMKKDAEGLLPSKTGFADTRNQEGKETNSFSVSSPGSKSFSLDQNHLNSSAAAKSFKKPKKDQQASPTKVSLPLIRGGPSQRHGGNASASSTHERSVSNKDLPKVSIPPSSGNNSNSNANGGFAYRVRGGGPRSGTTTADSSEWIAPPSEEDEERALRKKLAKAKKKIEKNLKIQEWLEKKEERAAAALQAEREEREAMEAAEKAKEEKRKQRAKSQKKKLNSYYKQVKDECEKIQEYKDLGIDPSNLL